jgi:hypothetical protein
MLAEATTWSGQITNDGVWWLLATVAIVLLVIFIGVPIIERMEDTGHEDEDD